MNGDQVLQIVIVVVAPVVTAVVGLAALTVGDWRQRRTEAGRRKLAFEDATRQVAFATEWVNAVGLTADNPEAKKLAGAQAARWLEEASGLVGAAKPLPTDRPVITLRRLLLAYPLHSRAARFFRTMFYIAVCLVPWGLGLLMQGLLDRTANPGAGASGEMSAGLIMLIIVGLLSVGFRTLAARAENTSDELLEPHRRPLRRALLIYRLHGAPAKFIRLLFYCWILFAAIPSLGVALGTISDFLRLPLPLLVTATLAAYAIVLRYWAVASDERRMQAMTASDASHPIDAGHSGEHLVRTTAQ
jgi:hypothetical protein